MRTGGPGIACPKNRVGTTDCTDDHGLPMPWEIGVLHPGGGCLFASQIAGRGSIRELRGSFPFSFLALQILQEAFQHPERFLMGLDAGDGEVLSFEIAGFFGCVTEIQCFLNNDLVGIDQVGNKVF